MVWDGLKLTGKRRWCRKPIADANRVVSCVGSGRTRSHRTIQDLDATQEEGEVAVYGAKLTLILRLR